MTRFTLAQNYRGAAAPTKRPPAAAAEATPRHHFSLFELAALQVGQRVRVVRLGRVVAGEIVRLGPVPPLRDGRRVVRDLSNHTMPDAGSRKVSVRLQLADGRTRCVEKKGRELLRTEPQR